MLKSYLSIQRVIRIIHQQNGNPDLFWQPSLGQAVKSALVGVNLLDGESEEFKIVAAEMWHGELDVRNTSDGSSYKPPNSIGWPITVPFIDPPGEDVEIITFGIPVAADLDLDFHKRGHCRMRWR